MSNWKTRLGDRIPEDLGRQIDIFETQIELRKQGKLDEKLFAETRLRRGTYGQRYDNGQRHDGIATRALEFPCGDLTKGPDTVWDAPGMQRIKLPMGAVTPEQLDVLAEVAEEYSDAILHVTTRQDIQLHFVLIDDTPDLMRRLAAVGITTQEACGNSVRNVTACQYAGVCSTQTFDVTPYADAMTRYLMGHRDTQDFGRKFKIAFSGCEPEPCGLANFHDLGIIAVTRTTESGMIDAAEGSEGAPSRPGFAGSRRSVSIERGFKVLVGGGLGAVPQQAKVLSEFVSEAELLPTAQAVCRVFARLGERKNRARARLKFVVQKLGIEEFREVVAKERDAIPPDERWTTYLDDLSATDETPLRPAAELSESGSPAFAAWRASNCRPQRQAGYSVATIRLPLGDFTSEQARAIADLARRYIGDGASLRMTVEQNICLRHVADADLPALHADLERLGLAQAGASEIGDIVACPGTDTCKLGISSSRGLAGELERRLAGRELHPDVRKLHIKASGCFNSCAQHHVADIGFLGVSRNVGGRRVAHFQLVVGGEWANNGGSYGLAIGAFPSKRIPEVVDRLTALWIAERSDGERLQAFIRRAGRAKIKAALDDLRAVPAYDQDKSFYSDWADAREYTIGDMGVGECAGEVVSLTEFGLAASEREIFEAQLELEAGAAHAAAQLAYRSMLSAAKALIKVHNIDVRDEPDAIVAEFRERFCDTRLFYDPFAADKFANYLFKVHANPPNGVDSEEAHRQIEEASLFIEAAHACYDRIQQGEGARA